MVTTILLIAAGAFLLAVAVFCLGLATWNWWCRAWAWWDDRDRARLVEKAQSRERDNLAAAIALFDQLVEILTLPEAPNPRRLV